MRLRTSVGVLITLLLVGCDRCGMAKQDVMNSGLPDSVSAEALLPASWVRVNKYCSLHEQDELREKFIARTNDQENVGD